MSDVYYKIDSKDLLDEMDHIIISSISTPCKEAVEKSGGYWLDHINHQRMSVIDSWKTLYNLGCDGYAVNILIDIIKSGEYDLRKIRKKFCSTMRKVLAKYGSDDSVIDEIFTNALKCQYSDKLGNKTKSAYEYSLEYQPLLLKVFNNKRCIISFGIMFIIGLILIPGVLFKNVELFGESLFASATISYVIFVLLSAYSNRTMMYLPLVILLSCVLVACYHILFTERNFYLVSKELIIFGACFLLWYPVLIVNKDRINQKYNGRYL